MTDEIEVPKPIDKKVKVLLLGDSNVGKSCLFRYYSGEEFSAEHLTTIGVDYFIKTRKIEGAVINFQVWDTAGQERFKTITKTYLREALGILVLYDITDPATFEGTKNWVAKIKETLKFCKVIIVGNKIDMEDKRKVSFEDGKKYADSIGYSFYEMSVKAKKNVDKVFQEIEEGSYQIYKKEENEYRARTEASLDLKTENPQKKKRLC